MCDSHVSVHDDDFRVVGRNEEAVASRLTDSIGIAVDGLVHDETACLRGHGGQS
jgi:hypothetical protein